MVQVPFFDVPPLRASDRLLELHNMPHAVNLYWQVVVTCSIFPLRALIFADIQLFSVFNVACAHHPLVLKQLVEFS